MYHVHELFSQYKSHKSETASNSAVVKAAAVHAHPDDEIVNSILYAEAIRCGIKVMGITLSRGEASTKNHREFDLEFALRDGDRSQEARDGALLAGFMGHEQLSGKDSALGHDAPRLVDEVAGLLVANEIDLVFGMSQMSAADSYDHAVAGEIGLLAARKAAQELGRVGVLTSRPDGRGSWFAKSSPESLEIVRLVAQANSSQFRVGEVDDRPDDWYEFTPGHAMHPEDWNELDSSYPITRDATYTYTKCGRLLVPQLLEF